MFLNRLGCVVMIDANGDFFLPSDVRDLISINDVMEDEELRLGPNGGLIFCLE